MLDDSDHIARRPTVIAGQTYADDFGVIWHGLPIGRIMKATGLPPHLPQWRWNINVPGKPGSASGSGADLDYCEAALKAVWAVIRASLTEANIVHAHETAKASTDALARYQQRRPV